MFIERRPTIENVEDAVQNFITEWCYECPIFDALDPSVDPATLKTLCPPSLLETCPSYLKIKLYHSVTGPRQGLDGSGLRPSSSPVASDSSIEEAAADAQT